MEQPRYTLPSNSKKYTCPKCKQLKKFKRYVDIEGEIEFPDSVGRCERQDNCAYHYTPKQFFADNPDYKPGKKESFTHFMPARPMPAQLPRPTPAISLMDTHIVVKSLNHYDRNNLVQYLCHRLGESVANELAALYRIGTSNHWNKQGATIFWQQDEQGKVRGGKVMLYDPATGKRRKEDAYKPTWVHSLLRLPGFTLSQCLFGLHQLTARPTDIVAIVESEKTALIATAFYPGFIWLSTGGSSNFNIEHCRVLTGRKVVLYPDLSVDGSVFSKWNQKARELATIPGLQISVSKYLEDRATDEQRTAGLDIADFLLSTTTVSSAVVQSELLSTTRVAFSVAPLEWDMTAQLTRIRWGVLPPGVEEQLVEPSDTYPDLQDTPNLPGYLPTITATSFHDFQ